MKSPFNSGCKKSKLKGFKTNLISKSVLITNSSSFQLLHDQEDALLHLVSVWIPSFLNVTDRYTMGTEKYHYLTYRKNKIHLQTAVKYIT